MLPTDEVDVSREYELVPNDIMSTHRVASRHKGIEVSLGTGVQHCTRRLVLTIVFSDCSVIRHLFRLRINLRINESYHNYC